MSANKSADAKGTPLADKARRAGENDLQTFLRVFDCDEVWWMNLATQHGIVSDNCVTAADVFNAGEAVARLMGRDLEKCLKWRASAW